MIRVRTLLLLSLGVLVACGGEDRSTPTGGTSSSGSQTGPSASSSSSSSSGSGASSSSGSGGGGGAGGAEQGWETLAPIDVGPLQENAVVALAGEVFVIGGYDEAVIVDRVEAYDPNADTWRSVAPLPSPRHHVNAAVVSGKIYVLGGLVTNGFNAIGDTIVYDPSTNVWSPLTSMPAGTERGGATTGVVGSKIYVAGGYRGGAVSEFSAYDTLADQWENLADLPSARDHLVGGAINGIIYVMGGRAGGINGVLDPVDIYDPSNGSWTAGAPMITARAGCAAAVFGAQIFVLGGEGNVAAASGVFPQVEAYDTVSDSWSAHTDMPTPRHGTGSAVVGGVIYLPGGADTQAFGAVATNEAYRP
jgi:N-acetylneuraminic acid mutarotase